MHESYRKMVQKKKIPEIMGQTSNKTEINLLQTSSITLCFQRFFLLNFPLILNKHKHECCLLIS